METAGVRTIVKALGPPQPYLMSQLTLLCLSLKRIETALADKKRGRGGGEVTVEAAM